MNLIENILVAFSSIRANLVRAILTLMIIAVGITCLDGILTAIDTILFSMSNSFSRMGANTFNVYPSGDRMRSNRGGKKKKGGGPITFKQAMEFKKNYNFHSAKVSVNTFCKWNSTVKYTNKKTNPNIRLVGIDENYLSATSYDIAAGRNFSPVEIQNGDHKIIIGHDLNENLFNGKSDLALGKAVQIGNTKYTVIGVLESKGASMTASHDRRVFIPLLNAKRYYGTAQRNYSLMASVSDPLQIENAVSAAVGTMRNIRRLKASQDNDFEIRKSDGILETLKDLTTELRLATIAIALMTLVGAAIGLMNIMLVSVTERTREIGVRKALGATRFNILFQFLMEAVVITLMGGLLGIILGVIAGYALAYYIEGQFIIPYNWMALGIFVCIVVGTLSGLYPALKASRLDPIESLRYE